MPDERITEPAVARPTLSSNTAVDVALLRDPSDSMAATADLFRSPAFFRLHAGSFSRAWYAVAMDAGSARVISTAWFAEYESGHARSGARGPYGGFAESASGLPISVAARVLTTTESELRSRGISRVSITLPPAAHDRDVHAEWMNVYLRAGYRSTIADLNYHVQVTETDLSARMNSGNRAVVRTASRKGLFARALQASERAEAYAVNAQNRARRGRRMTMSLDALLQMDDALPDTVCWFGVFAGERMIAASVCLRVSPRIVYVFYLGEADGAERQSPVTILVSHIHDWCRDHGVALLDLGIATEAGVPNEGLMAYKRNLGFEVSPKYTLEKELVP